MRFLRDQCRNIRFKKLSKVTAVELLAQGAHEFAGAQADRVNGICRSGKRRAAAVQFPSEQAGYNTMYNVSKVLNGWAGNGCSMGHSPMVAVLARRG